MNFASKATYVYGFWKQEYPRILLMGPILLEWIHNEEGDGANEEGLLVFWPVSLV